jgi:hypothetical protein
MLTILVDFNNDSELSRPKTGRKASWIIIGEEIMRHKIAKKMKYLAVLFFEKRNIKKNIINPLIYPESDKEHNNNKTNNNIKRIFFILFLYKYIISIIASIKYGTRNAGSLDIDVIRLVIKGKSSSVFME